jgi:hypothetical protein
MVHALATPGTDSRPICRLVLIGRGDGAVGVLDADAQTSTGGGGGKKGISGARPHRHAPQVQPPLALLSAEQGGHRSAVNSVCFLPGGEGGLERAASAGNDGRILVWDLAEGARAEGQALLADVEVGAKANWVCWGQGAPGAEAFVADVEGRVMALRLR